MALDGIVDVTGWIPAGLVVVVVRLLDSSVCLLSYCHN